MATSATIKSALVTKLQLRAGVQDVEPVKAQLPDICDDALLEHEPENVSLDYTLIPTAEMELVLLLAWARVCDARASLSAPQSSLKVPQSGFGSDRDTPFYKNQKLAESLRLRYTELKSRLSASDDSGSPSGDITMGDLYRQDELLSAQVGLMASPNLPPPILKVGSIVGVAAGGADKGNVILNWPGKSSQVFYDLTLLQSAAVGIYQSWQQAMNGSVPQVDPAAVFVMNTTDNIARGFKVTGLLAGTYYFILAQSDINGRYTYSNEVSVIVPA